MDLKTFVAESLKQIAAGIKDAQDAHTGAWINPRIGHDDKGRACIGGLTTTRYVPQSISFDIAVSAAEGGKGSGAGGIQVFGMKIGGELESISQNSTISRIRFDIPISWPEPDTDRPKEKG